MNVPKYLLSDAILSACHLINRMPSSVLQKKVTYSCLYPATSVLHIVPHVFGCICFVQDLSPSLDKLSIRSVKYIFVGYSRTQHCFKYRPIYQYIGRNTGILSKMI